MRFLLSKAFVVETAEHAGLTGGPRSFPLATNKLREQAAEGLGEALALQREVERMSRTRDETEPLQRKVESLEDVTKGLGMRSGEAERLQRAIAEENPTFDARAGTPRVFYARSRLLGILRAMPELDLGTRDEVLRRAQVYWKQRYQTEAEHAPKARFDKALVLARAKPMDLEIRPERLIKGPYLPGGDVKLELATSTLSRGREMPRFVPVTGETFLVRHALRALGGRWDATSRTWQVPYDRALAAREIVAGAARREPSQSDPSDQLAEPGEPVVPDGATAEERFDAQHPGAVVGVLREERDGLMRVAAATAPKFTEQDSVAGWRWTEYLLPAMAADLGKSFIIRKSSQPGATPTFGPVAGATNAGMQTPELPDFRSLYLGPEAQKRQDKEAEQARRRRRSMWRDLSEAGVHGRPDVPELRYEPQRMRHYLTAKELRLHKERIAGGALDYGNVVGTSKGKRR